MTYERMTSEKHLERQFRIPLGNSCGNQKFREPLKPPVNIILKFTQTKILTGFD